MSDEIFHWYELYFSPLKTLIFIRLIGNLPLELS